MTTTATAGVVIPPPADAPARCGRQLVQIDRVSSGPAGLRQESFHGRLNNVALQASKTSRRELIRAREGIKPALVELIRRGAMKNAPVKWLMVVSAVVGWNASSWAQDLDAGRSEYLANCATCHGVDGRGQVSAGSKLKRRAADLTLLARRNGGVFSPTAVYEKIDGRNTAHGSGDMPVWGCRHPAPPPPVSQRKVSRPRPSDSPKVYRPRPTESHLDLSCDPEPVIRQRLLAIVEYLGGIQAK
jgi:mono/diheme cytochrome c family protein